METGDRKVLLEQFAKVLFQKTWPYP